jgi:serine/threonine protein kinase
MDPEYDCKDGSKLHATEPGQLHITPNGPVAFDDPRIKLGGGSGATVYRSAEGSWYGQTVAVKEILVSIDPTKSKRNTDLSMELEKLRHIRHPSLVSCFAHFRSSTMITLVLQYCTDGTLYDAVHLHPIELWPLAQPLTRAKICIDVVSALNHLHAMKIVHGNVSSTNVLLCAATRVAKLADFSLKRILRLDHGRLSPHTDVACSTSWRYWAKEMWQDKEVSTKSDIFSFAMLCYELECQCLPWNTLRFHPSCKLSSIVISKVRTNVCNGKRPKWPNHASPTVRPIVGLAWVDDPQGRPSAGQLVSRLETRMRALETLRIWNPGHAEQLPASEVIISVLNSLGVQVQLESHHVGKAREGAFPLCLSLPIIIRT